MHTRTYSPVALWRYETVCLAVRVQDNRLAHFANHYDPHPVEVVEEDVRDLVESRSGLEDVHKALAFKLVIIDSLGARGTTATAILARFPARAGFWSHQRLHFLSQ